MSNIEHFRWRVFAALAALLLLLGACSDSDDTVDDPSTDVVAVDSGGDGGSGGDSTTTTAAASSGGDSSGLESVWPLPPGDATVLFAYTDTNDGFSSRQAAGFEMTGVDVETAISFYEDYFAGTDYDVGARLPLGESIALNISMADNPNITAVVQAAVQSNGKLTLNQERSEFLETSEPDDGEAPDSSSSAGD